MANSLPNQIDNSSGQAQSSLVPAGLGLRSPSRISRIYWLVVAYIGVWILLRMKGVGGPPLSPESRAGLAAAFCIAVINMVLRTRSAALRGGFGSGHPSRLGWFHTIVDFSVICVGIRLTGGMSSGLWLVLLFAVSAETVLERTVEAWVNRGGAALALIIATVPWPLSGDRWQLELATRLVFLMAISSVTRRLREFSDREKLEVATLRAELELSDQRGNLARDIHDGVGNSLAAAVLRLEFAARVVEKQDSDVSGTVALLKEEAQALREAMTSVRDWTFFTQPWSPDAFVLEVERLSRRTGLPMRIDGAEHLETLPPQAVTGLTIVRVVQEALINAAKHCGPDATGVQIRLSREGSWLIVTVADDGCGFSTVEAAGTGLGISSMRKRVTEAGGTFQIESAPGAGLSLTVRLPAL